MKHLLTVLLLFTGYIGLGQGYNYYKDSIWSSQQSAWWNVITHAPADTTTKKSPAIIFYTGSGETGTDTANAVKYGPLWQLRQGVWNATARGEEFWIMHIQNIGTSLTQVLHGPKLKALIQRHPSIDTNRVYLTGLSYGGAAVVNQIRADGATDYYPYLFSAIVPMSVGNYTKGTQILWAN